MTLLKPHRVIREDRADGTILLRSGYGMSPPAARTTDWLDRWAAETPDALFLAERAGEGWRETPYGEARETVDALAGGLLAHGIAPGVPLMILSGNGIDHALLMLACQRIGVPSVPLAEQYSLIPGAEVYITDIARRVRPAMVYAADGAAFQRALGLEVFAGLPKLVSRNAGAAQIRLDVLAREGGDIREAAAAVGPDTVVKILMTSGSTSSPKGVETTHAMMCANQAQIADAFPFLGTRPPRLLDWLPWNHVFGSSHNFNLVLAHGGSMHIDAGKPVPQLVGETIRNAREIAPTIAFNVPVGFAMLRDAMRDDPALRERYFTDLDMLFYAGASLPQDIWADLEAMALEVRGDIPLFTSSWGLTETAPACLVQHEGTANVAGIVGVPMTGVTVKAVPDGDGRYEIRVKGPNVFKRYLNDPVRTAEAFDEEGFFLSGDAMRFVDAADMGRGLRFDGRLTEDFKLMTGTWVRAATLRLEILGALKGLVQDIALTGEGRDEVGLLAFPAAGLAHEPDDGAARLAPDAADEIRTRLAPWSTGGSATRIARVMILADPPSMAEGEVTAKGNLNFRRLLTRRAGLVERLYSDAPCVIRIGTDTP
ncbi:feruloyl-CoA synthase [Ovoidimarina sediminis]|uniref:feruloyl-CoA synthase n=1 Tax=Ovoidimarina sediminis TaxID=3079856 RepID=UPI002906943E|nr:feruloyl-CoA synthase [Rhodophyticola sp. MJ-SS7]MDU8943129.1 feruloyl-CoA synthase [Rhodophyticola sp. MJ-SS7]